MYPTGERLEPLGASDDQFHAKNVCNEHWENEKELLQNSLFALTTHLAQVQFRLRQVVNAPLEDQEDLLKSLEEFAFADVSLLPTCDKLDADLLQIIKKHRNGQQFLLGRLKSQLRQLKKYDEKSKQVRLSWNQLVERLQMKENLEQQLKNQIVDLERFVEYLKRVNCHKEGKSVKTYILDLVERAFLQMFTQIFDWASSLFTSSQNNHWGDLRAKLELAIIDLKKLLHRKQDHGQIVLAVRKSLATSIRDLMQHGTKSPAPNFPCLEYWKNPPIHGWDIISYYYSVQRTSSTFGDLAKSFNLAVAGCCPKKNLLCVIETITASHSRYKRSNDSQFKAFVCAALNAKRLVSWLNLIFHCRQVLDTYYYPWSYVARTKYEDGLRSLDILTPYKFDLPVDLDVRKFEIKDEAFV